MQRNEQEEIGFNSLPLELIVKIYGLLDLIDIASALFVNKLSFLAAIDNLYWLSRFKQHFPHHFDQLEEENKTCSNWKAMTTWRERFNSAHELEYQAYDKKDRSRKRRIFFLVKENAVDELQKENLTIFDLELRDRTGRTPLDWAKHYNQQPMLKLFFERVKETGYLNGLNELLIHHRDDRGRTLPYWAIDCLQPSIFKKLITAGCNPKAAAPENTYYNYYMLGRNAELGFTLLHCAAKNGLKEIVELLVSHYEVDPNAQTAFGMTPLLLAILNGREDIVDVLLKNGADLSMELLKSYDEYEPLFEGDRPLHAAIKVGREDIITMIIHHKRSCLEKLGARDLSPLRLAAERNQTNITELLIKEGAQIDQRSPMGATALLTAAEHGHEDIVRALLSANADPSLALEKNSLYHKKFNVRVGDTPLHAAVKIKHVGIVKILLEDKRININGLNNAGYSPLYLAASMGHVEITRLLIDKGAIVDRHNKRLMEYLLPLPLKMKFTLFGPVPVGNENPSAQTEQQQTFMRN